MSRLRRTKKQDATTSAVSWTIYEKDDFDIPRISIRFSADPTGADKIYIWLRSHDGSDFDVILRTIDPNGRTSIVEEDLNGIPSGDTVEIVFANTTGTEFRGTAVTQL